MKDDVRKYIYGAITAFLLVVLSWVSIVYVSSCGMTLTCNRASFKIERTPIPTLIPATLPVSEISLQDADPVALSADPDTCHVPIVNFIGAWAVSEADEAEPFYFVDEDGKNCEAVFSDVQVLFNQPNLRGANSLACVSCHSGDLTVAPAQLDLSSYAGIMAGSRREGNKPKGADLLGDGDWKASLLYDFLINEKTNIPGHEQALMTDSLLSVGKPFAGVLPTPLP